MPSLRTSDQRLNLTLRHAQLPQTTRQSIHGPLERRPTGRRRVGSLADDASGELRVLLLEFLEPRRPPSAQGSLLVAVPLALGLESLLGRHVLALALGCHG